MQKVNSEIFGRINVEGNVVILYTESGEADTQLDSGFHPVGSQVSTRYEHPAGIILSRFDADTAEISLED